MVNDYYAAKNLIFPIPYNNLRVKENVGCVLTKHGISSMVYFNGRVITGNTIKQRRVMSCLRILNGKQTIMWLLIKPKVKTNMY